MKNLEKVEIVENLETELERIASWVARYFKLGILYLNGFSPFLRQLINSKKLAMFEPILANCWAGQEGADAEYGKYDFTVELEVFCLGDSYAFLYIIFQEENAMLILDSYFDEYDDEFEATIENRLEELGIGDLSSDNFSKKVSWLEADQIIVKFLKSKAVKIPPPPTEDIPLFDIDCEENKEGLDYWAEAFGNLKYCQVQTYQEASDDWGEPADFALRIIYFTSPAVYELSKDYDLFAGWAPAFPGNEDDLHEVIVNFSQLENLQSIYDKIKAELISAWGRGF